MRHQQTYTTTLGCIGNDVSMSGSGFDAWLDRVTELNRISFHSRLEQAPLIKAPSGRDCALHHLIDRA